MTSENSPVPSYKLRLIKDVWDQVPADRILSCMMEIGRMMQTAKAASKVVDSVAKTEGVEGHELAVDFPEVIEWIDDNAEISSFQFASTDDSDLSLQMSPRGVSSST